MPAGSTVNMFAAIFPINRICPIKSQSVKMNQKDVPAEGVEECRGGLVLLYSNASRE